MCIGHVLLGAIELFDICHVQLVLISRALHVNHDSCVHCEESISADRDDWFGTVRIVCSEWLNSAEHCWDVEAGVGELTLQGILEAECRSERSHG